MSCRKSVLLVEDHDVVASLITKVLLQQGWEVIRAHNGAKAVGEFTQHQNRISLVMLDWKLPDTDGVSLSQRLRLLSPRIPVVLTSGRDQSSLIEIMGESGPTAFLPKPFYPQDVLKQVSSLVGTIA
jgi:DNA-binding response OmpR family regulator